MKRLHLTVEGQTEAEYAKRVITPHLAAFNVFVTGIRFTGPGRRSESSIPRGGMLHKFMPTLKDMRLWTKEDKGADARFSMMVDFYHLPHDFPGFVAAKQKHGYIEQVKALQTALAAEIGDERFIPYLQVHEFEALVLVDPLRLVELYEGRLARIQKLAEECHRFSTPEEINGGQHSHPKYRIKHPAVLPEYDENVAGPLVLEQIGLSKLREKCPHFNSWLTHLEGLDTVGPSPAPIQRGLDL